MKQVVMCPPTFFEVKYQINPRMNLANPVNKAVAKSQFDDLQNVYRSLGVAIAEIDPVNDLPDMVFAANFGAVAGDKIFIPSNFRYPERMGEAAHALNFFKHLDYKIRPLPHNLSFEGQGDLMSFEDRYVLGYGFRTNPHVQKPLQKILGKKVTAVELVDPDFYHLDTCLSVLSSNVVLINRSAFSSKGLQCLRKFFGRTVKIIETNQEDNILLCCNVVSVGNNVIVSKGISKRYKKMLKDHGLVVIEVAMSEFLKSGGSVKCLTLEL